MHRETMHRLQRQDRWHRSDGCKRWRCSGNFEYWATVRCSPTVPAAVRPKRSRTQADEFDDQVNAAAAAATEAEEDYWSYESDGGEMGARGACVDKSPLE